MPRAWISGEKDAPSLAAKGYPPRAVWQHCALPPVLASPWCCGAAAGQSGLTEMAARSGIQAMTISSHRIKPKLSYCSHPGLPRGTTQARVGKIPSSKPVQHTPAATGSVDAAGTSTVEQWTLAQT